MLVAAFDAGEDCSFLFGGCDLGRDVLETALIEKRDRLYHILGNRMQSNQLYDQDLTHSGRIMFSTTC